MSNLPVFETAANGILTFNVDLTLYSVKSAQPFLPGAPRVIRSYKVASNYFDPKIQPRFWEAAQSSESLPRLTGGPASFPAPRGDESLCSQSGVTWDGKGEAFTGTGVGALGRQAGGTCQPPGGNVRGQPALPASFLRLFSTQDSARHSIC